MCSLSVVVVFLFLVFLDPKTVKTDWPEQGTQKTEMLSLHSLSSSTWEYYYLYRTYYKCTIQIYIYKNASSASCWSKQTSYFSFTFYLGPFFSFFSDLWAFGISSNPVRTWRSSFFCVCSIDVIDTQNSYDDQWQWVEKQRQKIYSGTKKTWFWWLGLSSSPRWIV